jgi:hypothetical protein
MPEVKREPLPKAIKLATVRQNILQTQQSIFQVEMNGQYASRIEDKEGQEKAKADLAKLDKVLTFYVEKETAILAEV